MVPCAESTIGRSYIFCFVQHFALCNILSLVPLHCLQMFAGLSPCCSIETFCSESRKNSTICFKNGTFQCIETLPSTFQALFCRLFLWLAQHFRREKLLQASAANESLQCLLRNNSHSCFLSLRLQTYKSFSASPRNSRSVSITISSHVSVSQQSKKKCN